MLNFYLSYPYSSFVEPIKNRFYFTNLDLNTKISTHIFPFKGKLSIMERLKFDIPGLELRVKLNSKETHSQERIAALEVTVNRLIEELVDGQFKLLTRVTDKNTFTISISALPDQQVKSYQITFDIGLFKWIYDGLYIVLSNNSIFSGFGKSYSQFHIPTFNVPDWESLDIAMSNNEDVLFDADRMTLHDFLYTLCLSFVIQHEIRHIANGHIDYLRDQSFSGPLFYENSRNGLLFLDNQTLEMDVDSCVFVGILDSLLNNQHYRDWVPVELRDERGIFLSALFCIQFLFYCMPSKKVSNIFEVEKSSHPNAYLRYFFSFTAGLSFIQEKSPLYLDLLGNLHKDNFWEFIYLIFKEDSTQLDRIEQDFNWSTSKEGLNYMSKIWDNWNNWLPKLKPYAYLKLAPPNDPIVSWD